MPLHTQFPIGLWNRRTIADHFDSDSGVWLDGNLATASIITSNGRGIWTPSLGSNLLTNGGFSAWTVDNPDGWNVSESPPGTEISEVGSGEGHNGSGTGLCNIYSSGSSVVLRQFPFTINDWFRCDFDIDTIIAGSIKTQNSGETVTYSSTGTKVITSRALSTAFYWDRNSALNDVTIDNCSIKLIDMASSFRVQKIYNPSYVEVKVHRVTNTQKGVVLLKDINNYIVAWIHGDNTVKIHKVVLGSPSTTLGSSEITYAANGALRLTPNSTFNEFTVSYGGINKLTAVSISDFTFSGSWYAGIFTTYNSGDINSDAFDDFIAREI